MEKYGVELVEEKVKIAESKPIKTCPICDKPLKSSETTNVLACPVHGTKPFEGDSK